ncbi:MAG: sulfate adenylyltransferase [Pseudomonadota bacterium]|nr:sulfate adenylyltransferase [Pseudomonadales bacterium]MEC7455869.1 sulfate adenylyltransferase [Pseudomonadota bacterium]MEC8212914.1 sulfate adenylyltransferase [Pseudomonadota bacterium]MED5309705.1 sulfate adenylyltransferase [Pseudomonadota bacterium]|tara:strand:+ start:2444 stop:3628 length:1185 start_codon:yes stop_codon:yes gene_type:complete
MSKLIKPYGSNELLTPFKEIGVNLADVEQMPKFLLNDSAIANVVMLGSGYFNPLQGFMNKTEAISVCDELRTLNGLFWPIPVLNITREMPDFKIGEKVALLDSSQDHNPCIAIMNISDVEFLSDQDLNYFCMRIFGTNDCNHPGVNKFKKLGNYLVSGSIEVSQLSTFPMDHPDTFRTASQLREIITDLGWRKIVAFQTRNPMHRAHEEVCRIACERINADGLIIHMLLGKLKEGDIPAKTRDECIRTMVASYFHDLPVLISGYGFDMLYAGPREALLHAIVRQNLGATHLIIGRDHAGIGNFYGEFEAQEIFDKWHDVSELQIQIFKADHAAYSKKLEKVVMLNEVDNHQAVDFVTLSGTKLRELLANGQLPPAEVVRPEVAEILIDFYKLNK